MKKEARSVSLCLRSSPFGPVAVLWSGEEDDPKIRRVVLSNPKSAAGATARRLFPDSVVSSCPEIDILIERIAAFLGGEDIRFSLDAVEFNRCSDFQRQVLRAEHAIPRGRVSTYGLIASRLGNPKAARAVGTALARNPFPIIIPCHRAVRSDGSIGGYQGGTKMKKNLLEMEYVPFRDAGRVGVVRYFYG